MTSSLMRMSINIITNIGLASRGQQILGVTITCINNILTHLLASVCTNILINIKHVTHNCDCCILQTCGSSTTGTLLCTVSCIFFLWHFFVFPELQHKFKKKKIIKKLLKASESPLKAMT